MDMARSTRNGYKNNNKFHLAAKLHIGHSLQTARVLLVTMNVKASNKQYCFAIFARG